MNSDNGLKRKISDQIQMDANNQWGLSSALVFVSSIFKSDVSVKTPDNWNTTNIDNALLTTISDGDAFLKQIKSVRDKIVAQIDEITLKSSSIRAKYETNKNMMDQKVQEIRDDLQQFYESINQTFALTDSTSAEESEQEDPNIQVLETVNKVLQFSKDLQFKLGADDLFEHVSSTGVQITTNYFKARSMNRSILDAVAKCEEKKQPLQKQLIMIDDKINKVNREIALLKRFKTDHTEIITENKGPVVSGAPVYLLKTPEKTQQT